MDFCAGIGNLKAYIPGVVNIMWTEQDITTLQAAIASGVAEVTFTGPPARTVRYQNLTEMRSLLAEMRVAVNGTSSYKLLSTNKGFYSR